VVQITWFSKITSGLRIECPKGRSLSSQSLDVIVDCRKLKLTAVERHDVDTEFGVYRSPDADKHTA
jgi:hypothetical protein